MTAADRKPIWIKGYATHILAPAPNVKQLGERSRRQPRSAAGMIFCRRAADRHARQPDWHRADLMAKRRIIDLARARRDRELRANYVPASFVADVLIRLKTWIDCQPGEVTEEAMNAFITREMQGR
jgi:hypothetical protein